MRFEQGLNSGFGLIIEFIPPSKGGVVVVCARVDHLIALNGMRMMRVAFGLTMESKMHDGHATQLMSLAKFNHFGRDDTQVFGENFSPALGERKKHFKQLIARPLLPKASAGVLVIHRYSPVGVQTPEVVNSNHIK